MLILRLILVVEADTDTQNNPYSLKIHHPIGTFG